MGFALQRCRHVKICDTFRFGLYTKQWEVATLHRTDVTCGHGDSNASPDEGKELYLWHTYCCRQNMWSLVAAPVYNIDMLGAFSCVKKCEYEILTVLNSYWRTASCIVAGICDLCFVLICCYSAVIRLQEVTAASLM
jgi:hypothetical protein